MVHAFGIPIPCVYIPIAGLGTWDFNGPKEPQIVKLTIRLPISYAPQPIVQSISD
jgi:hypothetical protein